MSEGDVDERTRRTLDRVRNLMTILVGYRGLLVPVSVLDTDCEIPIAMSIRQEFVRRASQT
jgi:hypothetical protein